MYARTYRRAGVGQIEDATTRAIMDLPSRLPPVMTSLEFQPGFTPVAGQPGAFTVRMAAGGVMAWVEKNKMLVYVGAGTLLMLAMMSPAGRRRR